MRILAALTFLCLLAAGPAASIQTQTFSISGTVVDPAGSALPGVSVELRQGEVVRQKTVSNQAGEWRFDKVSPGSYGVRFTLAGFVTTEHRLQLADSPYQLRVVLKVGALAEEVVVDAKAEPVRVGGVAGGVPGGVLGGVVGGLPSATPVPRDALGQARYIGPVQERPHETATYDPIQENRFRRVADHPLSTFSIDVDTASYTNVRRFLNEGRLPPPDAVRVEEMINYFKYDYALPRGEHPVAITTEVGPAPWNPRHRLALVGIQAAPLDQKRTPPRNLTFLLDVSGSMAPPNRLPLVKTAMQMLVDTLRPEDRVAIVVYAGASGVALEPTSGDRKHVINTAIAELRASGSTHGAAGIQLAYELASKHFVKGGINRVILATDGDFNVGITSREGLTRLIEQKRETGIFLSVLGVGDYNLMDGTMQMLAQKGNGNHAYLDSIQEARRVLVHEAGATLVTVAKDVKVQVEFNPRFVQAYRLVGYESRMLKKEDFNDDRKDAGEMGAGHVVTALYEIVPPGVQGPATVDPLRYQDPEPRPQVASNNPTELMNVKVRYKPLGELGAGPDGNVSRLIEHPVSEASARSGANLGFASAVAEFGMLLRRSEHRGGATWEQMLSLGREHRGADPDGYRAELIRLAEVAQALDRRHTEPDTTARR
jgi:Ca-activated chloride channel homolog